MIIAIQNYIIANETNFWEILLKYVPLIVAIVGIVTLLLGLIQYKKSVLQNRSKFFLDMQNKFFNDNDFQKILNLLEADSEELKNIPYDFKLRFLDFYEQIAMLMNSKLIRKEVAFYMFGFYAIKICKSDNFWKAKKNNNKAAGNLNKNSSEWSLFRDFVEQMESMKKNFHFKRSDFII